MTLATVLAWASGLRLVAPDLDEPTVIGTALAIHTTDAVVCRFLAYNHGYSKNLWTVLGLIGGLWAVTVLILMPHRGGGPAPPRPLP